MTEFTEELVATIDRRIEKIDFELATTYDNAIPFLPEYDFMYEELLILRKFTKKLKKLNKTRRRYFDKEKEKKNVR